MGNKEDPIDSLDFKEMISTSNEMLEDRVVIHNSDPVLFCTTLNFADIWTILSPPAKGANLIRS